MSISKSKTNPSKDPKIASGKDTIQNWFESHFRVSAICILILAGALRLSLLLELPQMPFNQLYQAPDLDMNFFDQWGDRIAHGDFLTDTVWHPYHFWHAEISNTLGLQTEQEGKQKWNTWYGGKTYHQEPLYAQVIGIAKMVASYGRLLVYVLQMILTLVSIWMIMWLGRHYFTALAGIAGGLLFTFYGPALLFDATLIRTSFSTTLVLSCIVVGEQLIAGKQRAWLYGIIGGAGYLLMTTTVLLWIPVLLRWIYVRRQDIKQLWKVAIAFSFFISLLLARNVIVGAPAFSSSSVGPITYVLSNFPGFKPEMGFIFFAHAGSVMEESNGKMIPAALNIIGKHNSIWGWVILQFKKLGAVFHWFEVPNNVNTYLATKFSQTLKFTFIPYSFIAALGIVGIFSNLKNTKTINLHIGIWSQIVVMVVFYVLCRFRVPMVALLCVFAGYALQQLVTGNKKKTIYLTALGSIFMWLLIMRPFPVIPATYTRGDLSTNFNAYYRPKLDVLSAKGDLVGCADLIEEFIRGFPAYAKETNPTHTPDNPIARDVVYYSGLVHTDLGRLYSDIGNKKKADDNLAKGKLLMAVGTLQ